MFDFIYIEEAVREHRRVRQICARYPTARLVPCDRFGEVFNRGAQNFRLQKKRPALVLAEKHGNFVLEAPAGYGIGAIVNYYFSHMLNCIYDCRYCFLQGMYRSSHLVLFVNYEDFHAAIEDSARATGDSVCFFSGYDCDSLALEPLTGFASSFLPAFESLPDSATVELRTKSVQIAALLERDPVPNCVVAFSMVPDAVTQGLEPGVPSLSQRLRAMCELQNAGWNVGLRFDPLLASDDAETVYREFFERVFSAVDASRVHSVTLGPFRLPRDFHRRMTRLYPEEGLLYRGLEERDGLVSYTSEVEEPLRRCCEEEIVGYIAPERIFLHF